MVCAMPRHQAHGQAGRGGLGAELWYFLRQTRKWWLVPILIVLMAFGVVLLLSTTAAAPFIYTLF